MAKDMHLVTLITVRKMDRAIGFYTKSLGAKVTARGRGEMKNYWASLNVGGTDVWFVPPSKWEKRTLAYQTLLVKNIKSSVKRLKGKKVKFQKGERMGPDSRIEGPIVYETWGASAFFKDSEGNLLMLWQNDPPM